MIFPRFVLSLVIFVLLIANAAQAQSLVRASARFLGTPYFLGPLGEGNYDVIDHSPFYRFDEFDCTTFVETVIAIAGASSEDGKVNLDRFQDRLRRIRYIDGKISYVTRNHFPELDWIPNNEAAGWVTDVTAEVGRGETRYAEAMIDKRAWFASRTEAIIKPPRSAPESQKLLAQVHAFDQDVPLQKARLAYIPSRTLIGEHGDSPRQDLLDRLPDGAVVNIIRENWAPASESTPLLVSHQMLLLRIKGQPILRHASETRGVVDVPVVEYLREFLFTPTIVGINILKIDK